MPQQTRTRQALFVLLFVLAMAMAYLVGMHEERGRQEVARQELKAALGRLAGH